MTFGNVMQLPFQAPAPAAPYSFLVLDLETCDGSPDDAEAEMRQTWQPKSLLTWSEETIGKRLKAAYQKKLEKLALLDASPIIIISLRSDTELRCLHCLEPQAPTQLHGALVEGFTTQREMLAAFASLLNARCDSNTVLAGHAILNFDLRKLRHAYLKAGLLQPAALLNRDQPVYDTQRAYSTYFTTDRSEVMPALNDLLSEFGIESHKPLVDGAMIPRLYEQHQFASLIHYALLDAIGETALFCRMTGRPVP